MPKPHSRFTTEEDVRLTPTSTVQGITNAIYFDTETYIKEVSPGFYDYPLRLGVALFVEYTKDVTHRRYNKHVFTSQLDFVDLLEQYSREKTVLYVFAHNVGFDVRVLDLFNHLHDYGWTSKPPIINERTFIWHVKKGSQKIVFLDTANYGVLSVEKLGEDLGYPKLTVDFDNVSDRDLITYCMRDCEIIEHFITQWLSFVVLNGLGAFKTTLASQALNIFRTSFYANDIYLHNHRLAIELERDAYYGGRTECFHIGSLNTHSYYYVDVNSMYPFVMCDEKLPNRLLGFTRNVPLSYLEARLARFYVIADVSLHTDEPVYPYRTRTHLVFPVGRFRTYLHSDELLYALQHGHIETIHRCTVYDYGQVFKSYVDYMYAAKVKYSLEGNKSWRLVVKLLMNSLYGKFGQLKPHREMVGNTDSSIVWRMPHTIPEQGVHGQIIAWYGELWRDYKQGETSFSFPAVAGAITAKARMTLWKYIKMAGINHVFYCDTDSLITDKIGYERLSPFIDTTRLGYLNLEDTAHIVNIHGCKDYVFGSNIRHKGVPKQAKHTQPDTWEYMQFQGFQTWLNSGAVGNPVSWVTTKTRKHQYSKGIVMETGRVKPITFNSETAYRPSVNRYAELYQSLALANSAAD